MKKIFIVFALSLAVTFATTIAHADGLNPYDPTVTPPTGAYIALPFYPHTKNNQNYCPAKPTIYSYYPATAFPLRQTTLKSGAWSLDFEQAQFPDNWKVWLAKYNSAKAYLYLQTISNGICFDPQKGGCKYRSVIYPSASWMYVNTFYVTAVKFRVAVGEPAQWYLQIKTVTLGSDISGLSPTDPYLVQHQTDCNSLGNVLTSKDDVGVDTYMPLWSKAGDSLWFPLAWASPVGVISTPVTYTAIGNENIRSCADVSCAWLGYIMTGDTVTGFTSNGWLQIQKINGTTVTGYATLQYLR